MKYPKILHQISLFIFLFSLCKCLCVGAVEFKVTQRQTNYKVNGQSKRFQRVKGLHFLLAPRAPARAFCHLFFLFYFHVLFESIDYFMHFYLLCKIYMYFKCRIYTIFFGPSKHEFFMWSPPLPSFFF